MAENKKSIVVYADWINKFEELTDDEAGKLIKHFFRYVNDLNPEAPDRTTKLLFIDIENSLKRDLKKWEKRAERSRENGSLGGRPPKDKNLQEPEETQQVILKPKKPDSVNVSVSVSDSVNVSDNILEAEVVSFSFDDFWELYPNKTGKKTAKLKFDKLTDKQKEKIEQHLPYFINYKPFKEYNHPHASTYLNQERYNDEIQTNNNNLININNEQFTALTEQIRLNNPRI